MASSNFSVVKSEKREICPFNKAHLVPPERFANHLTKCRKQNPDIVLKICPFNAVHYVKEDDYIDHIASCKSKDVVEKSMYIQQKYDFTQPPAYSVNYGAANSVCSTSEENWESEQDNVSYNPRAVAVEKSIFRDIPHGLGKSGRQKWRSQEHKRLERLQQGISPKDLVFPNPDGTEISVGEFNKDFDQEEKFEPPIMSEQEAITKALMRVDIGSPQKPKTRIAANIFGAGELIRISGSNSSSIDDAGDQIIKKKKRGTRKKTKSQEGTQGDHHSNLPPAVKSTLNSKNEQRQKIQLQ